MKEKYTPKVFELLANYLRTSTDGMSSMRIRLVRFLMALVTDCAHSLQSSEALGTDSHSLPPPPVKSNRRVC